MTPSLTREYSQRLGVLNGEQLQAALSRFDLGKLLGAQPATAGLFGQNIFLTTSKGGYVFRGCPHYPWQFPKERYFAQQIHDHTHVPAPWPYLIDPTTDIFGWSYAIMPRLPGLVLEDSEVQSRLTDDDRLGLARALGENLALLQEFALDHPGEYDLTTDEVVPLNVSYPKWVLSRIRHDLDRCRGYNETTEADVAWAEEIIAETREALEVPFVPTLVHGDYWEHNIVASRALVAWRVTGVFDLMGMFVGDGEEDLVHSVAIYANPNHRRIDLARAFVQTYRQARHLRPGFAERFRLSMLIDRLRTWEYGQRNGLWFEKGQTFKEYASPYIALSVF